MEQDLFDAHVRLNPGSRWRSSNRKKCFFSSFSSSQLSPVISAILSFCHSAGGCIEMTPCHSKFIREGKNLMESVKSVSDEEAFIRRPTGGEHTAPLKRGGGGAL